MFNTLIIQNLHPKTGFIHDPNCEAQNVYYFQNSCLILTASETRNKNQNSTFVSDIFALTVNSRQTGFMDSINLLNQVIIPDLTELKLKTRSSNPDPCREQLFAK